MLKTTLFPIFLGIIHCFEADHVLAVASISNNKAKLRSQFLQGVTWGIGHSIPIILIGCTFVLFNIFFMDKLPLSLEVIVGVVLIIAGIYRLFNNSKTSKLNQNQAKAMLFVGLLHGLAGSAGVILAYASTGSSMFTKLLYFFAFSIGSIIGMGFIGILLSKVEGWLSYIKKAQWLIPVISICYGIYMIYKYK